jgi:hypothetical protein
MEKYSDTVFSLYGNAIPDASVSVYLAGTSSLATIYSDDGITQASNPLTTDQYGGFSFFAADGDYDIEVVSGSVSTTKELVSLGSGSGLPSHLASADPHTVHAIASPVSAAATKVGTAVTVALDGGRTERFTVTNDASGIVISVTGAPANKLASFVLDITNGGAGTVAYPAGTNFTGGAAPALTVAGKDRLVFLWDGSVWSVSAMLDVRAP